MRRRFALALPLAAPAALAAPAVVPTVERVAATDFFPVWGDHTHDASGYAINQLLERERFLMMMERIRHSQWYGEMMLNRIEGHIGDTVHVSRLSNFTTGPRATIREVRTSDMVRELDDFMAKASKLQEGDDA